MRNLTMVCASLVLLSLNLTTVRTHNDANLVDSTNRTLKEKEPGWKCTALLSRSSKPALESPQGISYEFRCTREEQSILGYVFYGNSKHDAVRTLERSQQFLQINDSRPLKGIGEQAYEYANHGIAWLTFRQDNVFVQLNVGIVDPHKMDDSLPEMKSLTAEALEIAKRFAQYIVRQIRAT